MSGHVALLGDSIFDNAVYVPGGPSVIEHIRRLLPRDWQATLLAVDGAVVSSVYRQLERLPADATHLVLSVGGNNALQAGGDVLRDEAETVWQGLAAVATVVQGFAAEYQALIRELRSLRKPLAVCTIYDAIPGLSPAETAGLSLFNDVITRTAFKTQATLIDLRLICNEATDYSGFSPIEPSAVGGGKIMRAVAAALFDNNAGSRVISG